MLEAKNLFFHYKESQKKILNDFSITLKQGEAVAIFWPSSSGKTTFLNIVWGLIPPNKWEVYYQNQNIYKLFFSRLCNYRKNKVWYSFQEFNLLNEFSAEENIILPFVFSREKYDQKRKKYICNKLKINNILNQKVETISWWEKERVAFARALLKKPEILILDEPWSNLNNYLKETLYQFIFEYINISNCIAFITSHDEKIIESLELIPHKQHQDLYFYKNKIC